MTGDEKFYEVAWEIKGKAIVQAESPEAAKAKFDKNADVLDLADEGEFQTFNGVELKDDNE